MADRLLRHKPTGNLYIWQLVFAENPDFEEVADTTSSAELEIPTFKKPKPAKAGLDTKPSLDAVLSAEASRNLP